MAAYVWRVWNVSVLDSWSLLPVLLPFTTSNQPPQICTSTWTAALVNAYNWKVLPTGFSIKAKIKQRQNNHTTVSFSSSNTMRTGSSSSCLSESSLLWMWTRSKFPGCQQPCGNLQLDVMLVPMGCSLGAMSILSDLLVLVIKCLCLQPRSPILLFSRQPLHFLAVDCLITVSDSSIPGRCYSI